MKCPRCSNDAVCLRTETGSFGTRRRRYHCPNLHRFSTVEAYEPAEASIERRGLMNALRAIHARITRRT